MATLASLGQRWISVSETTGAGIPKDEALLTDLTEDSIGFRWCRLGVWTWMLGSGLRSEEHLQPTRAGRETAGLASALEVLECLPTGRCDAARQTIQRAVRVNPESTLAALAQLHLAVHDEQWQSALMSWNELGDRLGGVRWCWGLRGRF